MKKLYAIAASVALCSVLSAENVSAQAFRKGSLLVSVSEGATFSRYSTNNTNPETDVPHHEANDGERDPLTIEYGVSKRWGVGINMGADIFYVDPSKFYGFSTQDNRVKAYMNEFTLDGNYHFFVTKKLDVCAFTSFGLSSVKFEGKDGDRSYKYEAGGAIVRTGIKAKYYIFRRFGVMGMLSAFSSNCSTKDVKDNTVGQGFDTKISGAALEFGLCYRILH